MERDGIEGDWCRVVRKGGGDTGRTMAGRRVNGRVRESEGREKALEGERFLGTRDNVRDRLGRRG